MNARETERFGGRLSFYIQSVVHQLLFRRPLAPVTPPLQQRSRILVLLPGPAVDPTALSIPPQWLRVILLPPNIDRSDYFGEGHGCYPRITVIAQHFIQPNRSDPRSEEKSSRSQGGT